MVFRANAHDDPRSLGSHTRIESLAAMGETVAYLSHYIRNIVQGLQGGAEVVQLGFKRNDLEIIRSGWALVRPNLERISQLTMNMLTFSKQRQPRIEPVPLDRIVNEVVSLVQARTAERSIVLTVALDDVPPIPLDQEGMHQVVHNIVLNAIDAVSAGSGRIDVKTATDPNRREVVLCRKWLNRSRSLNPFDHKTWVSH